LAEKFRSTSGRTAAAGKCSSFFAGKNRRTSTKEESLSKAKEIAEDWYLQLRGKLLTGELKAEKTFREVSEQFLRECEIMTCGEGSKQYVKGQYLRSSVHLVPFFGNMDISKITHGKNRGLSSSQTTSNCETRQAAGTQHHAPRNHDAAPDLEDRAAPWMARPASRFL